eukprot:jgi/Tetstr1/466732/TSEL_011205.t1
MGCTLSSSPAPAAPQNLGDNRSNSAAAADRQPPPTHIHGESTDAPSANEEAPAACFPPPWTSGRVVRTDAPGSSEEAAAAKSAPPLTYGRGDIASVVAAKLQLATDDSPPAIQCPYEAQPGPAPGAPPFLGSAPLRPVLALLGQRGVTMRWLLRFYDYVVAASGLERDASTKEVVHVVVKRDTQAQRCSYLQLAGVETGVPSYFVSHSWSQPFRYVVECLRQALADEEDAVVWLDMFALSQHQQDDPSAAKHLLCDLGDLKGAVKGMTHTLVVLDPAATVFTRAWCLLEMHTAVVAGCSSDSEKGAGKLQLLPYALDTRDAANLSKLMYGVDIDASQSYLPEDRQRILEEIERTVGSAAFNSTLKRAFASAVVEMVPRLASPSRQRADLARTAARVLFDGGYDDEAEAMYHEALENLRAVLGAAHPDTAACLSSLGDMLWRQDRLDEAVRIHQQALAIQRAADPASTAVAETLQKLANLQGAGEAEAKLREALGIWRSAAGGDHPQVAACLVSLDEQLLSSDRCDEKEAWCREAVRINQKALGPTSPETVYATCRLAEALRGRAEAAAGRSATQDEAEALLRKALASLEGIAPEAHPSGAETLHRLHNLLRNSRKFEEAVAAERKSLAIQRKAFGINHPSTADSLAGFAASYGSLEGCDLEEVVSAQRECIRIRREALRPNHPSLAQALEWLATFLRGTEVAEGERLLREAIDVKSAELGGSDREVGELLNQLADVLVERREGPAEEAEGLYRRALDIARATLRDAEQVDGVEKEEETEGEAETEGEKETEGEEGGEAEDQEVEEARAHLQIVLRNLADFLESRTRHEEAAALRKEAESLRASSQDSASNPVAGSVGPGDGEGTEVRSSEAVFQAGGGRQPLPERLGDRGVSVAWLRRFLRWAEGCFPDEPGFTTKQVVDAVVKRDTAAQQCAYCELAGVATAAPSYFVSHSWSQPFRDLVESVAAQLHGQPDAVVWLDIFALCQHQDTSQAAATQLLCDLDDLQSAVEGMPYTLVVVDAEGKIFTRAWCLLEMHSAVTGSTASTAAEGAGPGSRGGKLVLMPHLLDVNQATSTADMMYGIDVQQAEAYLLEDKERIVSNIQQTVGAAHFNKVLKEALIDAVEQLATQDVGSGGVVENEEEEEFSEEE